MVAPHWQRSSTWYTIGLSAIALITIHGLSSLVLTTLVFTPHSQPLVLLLGAFFTISGAAVGLQSFQPRHPLTKWATSLLSGATAMALIGCYIASELGGQRGAMVGTTVGFLVGGSLGVWTVNHAGWGRVVLSTISSLCSYGAAFGLSGWAMAAMTAQRWTIALGLGLLAGLYLWITQRAMKWTYHQWRRCMTETKP